jgi:hypothetical protein
MSWREEPASEKQLEYLKTLGYEPEEYLTKGQASDLIEELKNDPEAQQKRAALNQQRCEQEFQDSQRNMAYHLHKAYEAATRELAAAGKDEIRDAKAYLQDTQQERLTFWRRAFEPPDGDNTDPQPIKLYLEHGYRFKPPSSSLLQTLLDALDADSATWDLDMPEYLFQTVEYNCPDLLRKSIDEEELAFLRKVYAET